MAVFATILESFEQKFFERVLFPQINTEAEALFRKLVKVFEHVTAHAKIIHNYFICN